MTPNSYKTILNTVNTEIKENKSTFIAKACCISQENEVFVTLDDLRKTYFDATHHCYAYVLRNGKSKFSDDGEPHGTAGVKILSAINHFQLKDCLVVVIRYFGGIKLGIGPLSRVYYHAAFEVLSKADIVIRKPYYLVNLTVEFSFSDKVLGYLHRNHIKIVEENYESNVSIKCLIPVEKYMEAYHQMLMLSGRKMVISKLNEVIYD